MKKDIKSLLTEAFNLLETASEKAEQYTIEYDNKDNKEKREEYGALTYEIEDLITMLKNILFNK